jgi:hypothetical protein
VFLALLVQVANVVKGEALFLASPVPTAAAVARVVVSSVAVTVAVTVAVSVAFSVSWDSVAVPFTVTGAASIAVPVAVAVAVVTLVTSVRRIAFVATRATRRRSTSSTVVVPVVVPLAAPRVPPVRLVAPLAVRVSVFGAAAASGGRGVGVRIFSAASVAVTTIGLAKRLGTTDRHRLAVAVAIVVVVLGSFVGALIRRRRATVALWAMTIIRTTFVSPATGGRVAVVVLVRRQTSDLSRGGSVGLSGLHIVVGIVAWFLGVWFDVSWIDVPPAAGLLVARRGVRGIRQG